MADNADALTRIEARLNAILAILTEDLLRAHPELASPRPRSIDRILADAGLNQNEIADLLGKKQQSVSEQLRKSGWRPPRSRGVTMKKEQ